MEELKVQPESTFTPACGKHLLLLQTPRVLQERQQQTWNTQFEGGGTGDGGRLLQGPPPVSTVVDEPASTGVFLFQRSLFIRLLLMSI